MRSLIFIKWIEVVLNLMREYRGGGDSPPPLRKIQTTLYLHDKLLKISSGDTPPPCANIHFLETPFPEKSPRMTVFVLTLFVVTVNYYNYYYWSRGLGFVILKNIRDLQYWFVISVFSCKLTLLLYCTINVI